MVGGGCSGKSLSIARVGWVGYSERALEHACFWRLDTLRRCSLDDRVGLELLSVDGYALS